MKSKDEPTAPSIHRNELLGAVPCPFFSIRLDVFSLDGYHLAVRG